MFLLYLFASQHVYVAFPIGIFRLLKLFLFKYVQIGSILVLIWSNAATSAHQNCVLAVIKILFPLELYGLIWRDHYLVLFTFMLTDWIVDILISLVMIIHIIIGTFLYC